MSVKIIASALLVCGTSASASTGCYLYNSRNSTSQAHSESVGADQEDVGAVDVVQRQGSEELQTPYSGDVQNVLEGAVTTDKGPTTEEESPVGVIGTSGEEGEEDDVSGPQGVNGDSSGETEETSDVVLPVPKTDEGVENQSSDGVADQVDGDNGTEELTQEKNVAPEKEEKAQTGRFGWLNPFN